jgi:hypothetical protein
MICLPDFAASSSLKYSRSAETISSWAPLLCCTFSPQSTEFNIKFIFPSCFPNYLKTLIFIEKICISVSNILLLYSVLRLKGGSTWSETSAVRKLREIAKSPFDLTAVNAVSPERIAKMQV